MMPDGPLRPERPVGPAILPGPLNPPVKSLRFEPKLPRLGALMPDGILKLEGPMLLDRPLRPERPPIAEGPEIPRPKLRPVDFPGPLILWLGLMPP